MKVETTALPDVLIVTPIVRADARGSFHESWQLERYAGAGLPDRWVQDNVSRSKRGVLRGLHFQHPRPQGKLVAVLVGEILDVAVDIRRGSPTFGQSVAVALSAAEPRQLYVPTGFAHGFLVTSEEAVVQYKCTDYYVPEYEGTIAWNDAALNIGWPSRTPLLSSKDAGAPRLADLSAGALPVVSEA